MTTTPTKSDREDVANKIDRAIRKFPTWPTDPLHAVAVLGEEFGGMPNKPWKPICEVCNDEGYIQHGSGRWSRCPECFLREEGYGSKPQTNDHTNPAKAP